MEMLLFAAFLMAIALAAGSGQPVQQGQKVVYVVAEPAPRETGGGGGCLLLVAFVVVALVTLSMS